MIVLGAFIQLFINYDMNYHNFHIQVDYKHFFYFT